MRSLTRFFTTLTVSRWFSLHCFQQQHEFWTPSFLVYTTPPGCANDAALSVRLGFEEIFPITYRRWTSLRRRGEDVHLSWSGELDTLAETSDNARRVDGRRQGWIFTLFDISDYRRVTKVAHGQGENRTSQGTEIHKVKPRPTRSDYTNTMILTINNNTGLSPRWTREYFNTTCDVRRVFQFSHWTRHFWF